MRPVSHSWSRPAPQLPTITLPDPITPPTSAATPAHLVDPCLQLLDLLRNTPPWHSLLVSARGGVPRAALPGFAYVPESAISAILAYDAYRPPEERQFESYAGAAEWDEAEEEYIRATSLHTLEVADDRVVDPDAESSET